MAGNVLWTSLFNKPDSQSQDLTRQRIVQEERCGRRSAEIIPGPTYDLMVRGLPGGPKLLDPWTPSSKTRHSVQPPLVGYGGTLPRVRPEHTGKNNGEQAAHFVPHFGSKALAARDARRRRAARARSARSRGRSPARGRRPASASTRATSSHALPIPFCLPSRESAAAPTHTHALAHWAVVHKIMHKISHGRAHDLRESRARGGLFIHVCVGAGGALLSTLGRIVCKYMRSI